MSCKLTTRLTEVGREVALSEREFDQERITIGRGTANDVVLKDPACVVSTKHAEIRARNGAWSLYDVGSTNGTVLNGVRITPKQGQVLHDGDRITIGPFELVFESGARARLGDADRHVVVPVYAASGTAATDPQRLLYLLRRAAAETHAQSEGNLEDHLEQLLRNALAGCDQVKAESIVQSVKAVVQQSSRDVVAVAKESPGPLPQLAAPRVLSYREEKASVGEDLAGFVYEELGVKGATLNSNQMANQIASVLQVVFAGLADAVRGRREFQKEFEVEATRILAWTPNPIKHAEGSREIGTILLDPESIGLTTDQVARSLKEVFQDLTLHQLGLMAGFRECIRGLLKELDPEVLGKSPKVEASRKGIGLLSGGNVRAEAAAWRRYIDKHRQLTEEEVKVFERILAPHFAKGYLSVHKTRRRP